MVDLVVDLVEVLVEALVEVLVKVLLEVLVEVLSVDREEGRIHPVTGLEQAVQTQGVE
jgi:hypothetical protein